MATKTDPEKEKKQRRDFLKQAAEMLEETKKQLLREMHGRVKDETARLSLMISKKRDSNSPSLSAFISRVAKTSRSQRLALRRVNTWQIYKREVALGYSKRGMWI